MADKGHNVIFTIACNCCGVSIRIRTHLPTHVLIIFRVRYNFIYVDFPKKKKTSLNVFLICSEIFTVLLKSCVFVEDMHEMTV